MGFPPDVTPEAQHSQAGYLLGMIEAILPKWQISSETFDRWYRSLYASLTRRGQNGSFTFF